MGIEILTNDPKALRQDLLTHRNELADKRFETIITFVPEGGDRVFLCHKSVELSDA